jgi:hypothetical protein
MAPSNPVRIYLPQDTSDFRRARFSLALSLLMPTYALIDAPTVVPVDLHCGQLRSSTAWLTPNPRLRCITYSRSFTALYFSASKLLRTF